MFGISQYDVIKRTLEMEKDNTISTEHAIKLLENAINNMKDEDSILKLKIRQETIKKILGK